MTRLQFELTEENCVEIKDTLLDLLSVENDDTFKDNADKVLNYLETSAHLFDRIGYSYKAAEIARRIDDRCHLMKQLVAVKRLSSRSRLMDDMYHGLQRNRNNR